MRFHGNEICCGSYVCLNAMKDKNIDLQLFEISMSVPFGIQHMENSDFDRLLTTFCDPNKKMDDTIRLWGYDVCKYSVRTPEEGIQILKTHLQEGPAVIGPIDMGALNYLIMPEVLRRMDHYITLQYWSEREVICIDSEGIGARCLTYQQLEKCISVQDVHEARGMINIRFIQKRRSYSMKYVLEKSFFQAIRNLQDAERCQQGAQAIWSCYEYVTGQDIYKWKLPLMYDLEYLLQRKYMLELLIEKCKEYNAINEKNCEHISLIGKEQRELLGKMYLRLRNCEKVQKSEFERVGELEKLLSKNILLEKN